MPTVVSVFGVQPLRIGGTETFARELSQQLANRGWQSVLCFETEPPKDVREFLTLPNVRLEIIDSCTKSSVSSIKALSRVLRIYNPEILHLHFIGFVGLYPWLAKLFSVKKIFFTDHSSRPSGYVPLRAALWKRWLIRFINYPISKVFCVSKYGYRCLTTLDVLPETRFQMIYNGVDLSRVVLNSQRSADFRAQHGIPLNAPVVLQVSWIIPEKGIPDLLETARLVVAKNPHTRFLIVGDGPYRKEYMARATQMGLDEHIIWTGVIEDPFVTGVFEVADIVCQLSNWEEVFGWMIAESMAFGKPVIATRVGGIPELVQEGESGFLVERGDAMKTAERILMLISDQALRERMGAAGRAIAYERFALKDRVSELTKAYGV